MKPKGKRNYSWSDWESESRKRKRERDNGRAPQEYPGWEDFPRYPESPRPFRHMTFDEFIQRGFDEARRGGIGDVVQEARRDPRAHPQTHRRVRRERG